MINLTPRDYQKNIFETAKNNNTLVVLPTGIGKTLIGLMLTIERQKKFPGSKALFLAPTRPLVEQHLQTFKKELPELFASLEIFTGSVPASKRKKLFEKADIIFSTPQCISNDLKNNLYGMQEVSLLILDESHRCLKNYAYTSVVNYYKNQALNQRILGLTASPGHEPSKIKEICKHLKIDEIELRTRDSPDVKSYLQKLEFEKVEVDFPKEFVEMRTIMQTLFNSLIDKLRSRRLLFGPANKISLLQLQNKLFPMISQRNFNAMMGVSLTAQAIKLAHALELLETQTLSGLDEYIQTLLKQAEKKQSRAVQTLVNSPEFKAAFLSLKNLRKKETEHPKIKRLSEIVKEEFNQNENAKIIVFSQFRETASTIAENLNQIPQVKAKIFIGQAKKLNSKGTKTSGLNQKEQKAIIEEFRENKVNVLCATSVHPDEYIVIKKEDKIFLEKIENFINKFLKSEKNKTQSKQIEGYETLTSDGEKVFFAPITHVHKHQSKNNCYDIKLNSGLNSLITKDHSLFSFGLKDNFIPTIPKKNKFISLALKCPNVEKNKKVDILKELNENIKNLFGSLIGLTQAKIRELKTDLEILSHLERRKQSISDLSRISAKNYSTIHSCLKRNLKNNFTSQKTEKEHNKKVSSLTNNGKEYLKFLRWFSKNVKYHKGKYKFKLNEEIKKNPRFDKFFKQKVGINYGKVNFPRFLQINKYLARFLGFYVSEGSTRKTKYTSGVFLAARKKKMQKLMKESVEKGLKLKTRSNWRGIAIDSQIAHYIIKYIFKAGVGSYNKEVPQLIFSAPSKIKWEFLKAYFLGDGHISKAKNRIVLTTVSRKLATGLILLLRMLKIEKITLHKQKNIYKINIFESLPFAKINKRNEKRGKAYYSLIPKALDSEKTFNKYKNLFKYNPNINEKCRKNGKWNTDICFDYIKSMKKLKRQPKFVYDLSVKKTENFLGGTGLITLHNSIGEEGLDIPEVSAVIFYEPIASAIRKIQRAGRTARLSPGKLLILVTKDTRDVAYYYASAAREKKMHKSIDEIKKNLKNKNIGDY